MLENPPEYVLRVQQGAEFLDNVHDSWFLLLNPETLDIGDPDNCIGAQLGKAILGKDYKDWSQIFDTPPFEVSRLLLHGFNYCDCGCVTYTQEDLNSQWRYEIESRRRAYLKSMNLKNYQRAILKSYGIE